MSLVRCCDCGTMFVREASETWKTRCVPCYKKSKRAESLPADSYWPDRAAAAESMAATLKREVSALQCQLYSERQTVEALIQKQNGKQGGSLDRELAEHWRSLVQLVHPDKHGGSPGATRLTAWLNGIKGRLPCA